MVTGPDCVLFQPLESTEGVRNSSMADALAEKQRELDNLRAQFDSFVESSQELEQELERSLKDAEASLAEALKKKSLAEEKLASLQENSARSGKEQDKLFKESDRIKERLSQVEADKI